MSELIARMRDILSAWLPTRDRWEEMGKLVEKLIRRLEALDTLCTTAAQAVNVMQDWLGGASTREAALDSLYRLMRALEAAGYPTNRRDSLDWRGSLVDELAQAGFFSGADGCMHYDPQGLRRSGDATGPTLLEMVAEWQRLRGSQEGQAPQAGSVYALRKDKPYAHQTTDR